MLLLTDYIQCFPNKKYVIGEITNTKDCIGIPSDEKYVYYKEEGYFIPALISYRNIVGINCFEYNNEIFVNGWNKQYIINLKSYVYDPTRTLLKSYILIFSDDEKELAKLKLKL